MKASTTVAWSMASVVGMNKRQASPAVCQPGLLGPDHSVGTCVLLKVPSDTLSFLILTEVQS